MPDFNFAGADAFGVIAEAKRDQVLQDVVKTDGGYQHFKCTAVLCRFLVSVPHGAEDTDFTDDADGC